MKEKIEILIIGILLGAILTTGFFLVFGKNEQDMLPEPIEQDLIHKRQIDGNFIPRDKGGIPDMQNNNSISL